MVQVKQLLGRKGHAVWSVDADEPVLEAIQMMADKHVGALPVTRGGDLVGIISERDYARKVILMGRSSADTRLSDVMSSPVLSVASSDSIEHCMQMMTDHKIRHLPVLDGGNLAGMVSIGDLLKALLELRQREIEQLQQYITG